MNATEYQKMALRTMADQEVISKRIYKLGAKAAQLDNAARGLSSDAGEFSNCVQRWLEYGKELDVVHCVEELGDCLWRLNQACDALGVTLETVMRANIDKLAKRYPLQYSDHLADEANRHRDEERKAMELSIQKPAPASLNELVDIHDAIDPVPVMLDKYGGTREQTGQGWAEPPLDAGDYPIKTPQPAPYMRQRDRGSCENCHHGVSLKPAADPRYYLCSECGHRQLKPVTSVS